MKYILIEEIPLRSLLEDEANFISSEMNDGSDTFECIAYIDDDPMDTWLAIKVLEFANICNTIVTATNGRNGWEMLQEYALKNGRLPEVIIVDYQMPLMDGLELIDKIKESYWYSENKSKVILISVGMEDSDMKKIMDLDIQHFMLKPFDKDVLLQLIRK